jgi:hypothetical protein
MSESISNFIHSLSVGTTAQNFGVYSILGILLLTVIVQHKIIAERKKKKKF